MTTGNNDTAEAEAAPLKLLGLCLSGASSLSHSCATVGCCHWLLCLPAQTAKLWTAAVEAGRQKPGQTERICSLLVADEFSLSRPLSATFCSCHAKHRGSWLYSTHLQSRAFCYIHTLVNIKGFSLMWKVGKHCRLLSVVPTGKEADAYEVLGVEPTATSGEIKKRYWRLSLLIHPDKCGHPRANDAFQAVSKVSKDLQVRACSQVALKVHTKVLCASIVVCCP